MSKVLERLRAATAARLRSLAPSPPPDAAPGTSSQARAEAEGVGPGLLPIASGKGGVGKTNLAVNLAVSAALAFDKSPRRAILVEGDLGLPNADLVLGVRPPASIGDFARRDVELLSALLSPTRLPNLYFLAGEEEASLLLGNLYYQMRKRLERAVGTLKADLVVFDLGASASKEVLDFFSLSDTGLVVTTPEPTALRDAYVFLKNALLRRLEAAARARPDLRGRVEALARGERRLSDILREIEAEDPEAHATLFREVARFKPRLVVNLARDEEDARLAALRFSSTAAKHLGIVVEMIGWLPDDPAVGRAVRKGEPFRLSEPNAPASKAVDRLRDRILRSERRLGANLLSLGRAIADRVLGRTGAEPVRLAPGSAACEDSAS